MCVPTGDGGAGAARKAEMERQRNIRAGTSLVNNQFSQFNDDFFSKRAGDYRAFALPDLERQLADARQKLTFALARTGNLNSSVGAQRFADLSSRERAAREQIENRAMAEANSLRGNVESARSGLIRQITASGDASGASEQAALQARQLVQPVGFDPIGAIFAPVTEGLAEMRKTQQRSEAPGVRIYRSDGSWQNVA